MANTVFCIVPDGTHASRVSNALVQAGFASCDISVPRADARRTRRTARDYAARVLEGAAVCAGLGGALGALSGWVAGLLGVAPSGAELALSGPSVPLLIGACVGAAVGSLTGSLIGLGIPLSRSRRYLNRIKRGGVLLSVRDLRLEDTREVERILERAGGVEISTAGEIDVPQRPTPLAV